LTVCVATAESDKADGSVLLRRTATAAGGKESVEALFPTLERELNSSLAL
jgi:hypothetical protein